MYTMKEIEQLVKGKTAEDIKSEIIAFLMQSECKGAKKILNGLEKRSKKKEAEIERYTELTKIENQLYDEGITRIAGLDEAGRGPLVGPVVAGCVILEKDAVYPDLKDSKKLNESKRELLYEEITSTCVTYGVGIVNNIEIDRINILNATKLAMKKALENLKQPPQVLIIDSVKLDGVPMSQFVFNQAEDRASCVAAASIIAKVTRDRMMVEYSKEFPEYGFEKHKGYGTAEHLRMLKYYGPCKLHRLTFKKVLIGNLKHFSKTALSLINRLLSAHDINILKKVASDIRNCSKHISDEELSYMRILYAKVKALN
ncbi:ribonuclease HII [bacterium]|nr:ribonuclease HII [bacterium]